MLWLGTFGPPSLCRLCQELAISMRSYFLYACSKSRWKIRSLTKGNAGPTGQVAERVFGRGCQSPKGPELPRTEREVIHPGKQGRPQICWARSIGGQGDMSCHFRMFLWLLCDTNTVDAARCVDPIGFRPFGMHIQCRCQFFGGHFPALPVLQLNVLSDAALVCSIMVGMLRNGWRS